MTIVLKGILFVVSSFLTQSGLKTNITSRDCQPSKEFTR